MRMERRPAGFPWEEHYCFDEAVSGPVDIRGGYCIQVFVAIYLFPLADMESTWGPSSVLRMNLVGSEREQFCSRPHSELVNEVELRVQRSHLFCQAIPRQGATGESTDSALNETRTSAISTAQ